MQKSDKERVVAELTESLRTSETLIVADYRGLTNAQIDGLRSKLLEHGARFAVVKNTLTRRAAEAAGADVLLALLEGPSAIAFVESDGDPVAVAKALSDAATSTKVLAIRGGVLEGSAMSAEEVQNLAKLPPADVLRALAAFKPPDLASVLLGRPSLETLAWQSALERLSPQRVHDDRRRGQLVVALEADHVVELAWLPLWKAHLVLHHLWECGIPTTRTISWPPEGRAAYKERAALADAGAALSFCLQETPDD